MADSMAATRAQSTIAPRFVKIMNKPKSNDTSWVETDDDDGAVVVEEDDADDVGDDV